MKSKWPTTSRHDRGYGTQWTITRIRILERDGYLCKCSECRSSGAVRVAQQVDHIVSKAKAAALGWTTERTEADENLQAINKRCHERKTIQENGGTPKPKRKIGIDGFPIREDT